MTKPTILIVEDDGILAIHLQDLLSRQEYRVLKVVPTGEKAVLEANKLKPDLILMDIELAGEINGITAAQQITSTSDIPVIFLTGYSQDSMLQNAKFATPYGYLVKPVPERELAATIEMALYKFKIDKQIKISEAKYRGLIEQASDGIFLSDKQGDYIEVNTAGCDMLGYSRDEILKMNIRDIISPEDLAATPARTKEMEEGDILRTERQFVRKNGTRFPVEISGRMLENGSLQGIVRDVTERKLAENLNKRNENRMRSLLEITAYEAKNTQDLLDFALQKAIDLTESKIGYIYFYDETKQEFSLNTWSKEVMQECNVMDQQNIYQLEKTGFWGEAVRQRRAILDNDFQAKHPLKKGTPEGHVALKKFLTVPVFVDKSIVAVVGMANKTNDYDATDELQLSLMMDTVWKIVEKTIAEDKLRLEAAALNAAANAIVITNRDGIIEWANPAFTTLSGFTLEEVYGKNPRDLIKSGLHPDEFYKTMWDTILSGQVWHGEIVNKRKDGNYYNEEMTITPLPNSDGEIQQFIAIKQDITGRKKLEEVRRNLEDKFTQVFQTSPDAITISTLADGKYIDVNEGFCNVMGYTSGEAIGKTSFEIGIWPDPEMRGTLISELTEKGEVANLEIPFRAKNGQIKTCLLSSKLIDINNEKCVISIVRDISERISMEHKLQYSEERYRLLFEEMAEGFALHEIILDENQNPIDYRFLDINPAFERQTGLRREEIIDRTVKDVLPQTEDYWIQTYGKVALTGDTLHYENFSEAINKWFSVTAFSPKFGQFAVTFEDITTKKAGELALAESEEKFRSTFEQTAIGMAMVDLEGNFLNVNKSLSQLTGYAPDELIGNSINMVTHPDDIKLSNDYLQKPQNGGEQNLQFEKRYIHKNGQVVWVSISSTLIRDMSGNPKHFVTQIIDITRRRMAEEGLNQRDKIFTHSLDMLFIAGFDGFFKVLNPAWEKNLGWSLDELYSKPWLDFVYPDDKNITLTIKTDKLDTGKDTLQFENRYICKDGTTRWLSWNSFPYIEENIIVGVARDITETKKTEIKVQEQLDELRRWNSVTLGRENRILELKLEVNKLLAQSNQPPRYSAIPDTENTHD